MNKSTVICAVAGGLAALALSMAQDARANTADDAFVETLTNYGISNHRGDTAMIAVGHEICNEIDTGIAPSTIAHNFNRINSGLSEGDWAYVAGAAVSAYCPWDLDVNYDGTRSRLGV